MCFYYGYLNFILGMKLPKYNSNIDPTLHLNRSGLHLSYEGTVILANDSMKEMGYWMR